MESDPFINLPEEVILYNCNLMTNEELDNFTRLNKRNFRICQEVIDKRKNIRKTKSNIPLSANVVKHIDPIEKGLNHIEIKNNEFDVEVIYSYTTNDIYIEFQAKSDVFIIATLVEGNEIPQFIHFLENLQTGHNKFKNLSINISLDFNTVIIYEDNFNYQIVCSYDNFSKVLSDMITYIKKRYYDLRLGITSN